jgi:hypothetical protein
MFEMGYEILIIFTWSSQMGDSIQSEFIICYHLNKFIYMKVTQCVHCSSGTSSSIRFATVGENDLENLVKSRISANTRKKEKWCVSLFIKWLAEWRCRIDNIPKVLKDIDEWTASDINHALKYFIAEVRKEDGN